MTEFDASLARALHDALPAFERKKEWVNVLEDARLDEPAARLSPFRSRRRLLAIAIAAAVAVSVPIAALSGSLSDWWFANSGASAPVGQVAVAATGKWNGIPWLLTAYRTSSGVCVGLTPNSESLYPATDTAGHSAAMTCNARIVGVSDPSAGATHQLAYVASLRPSATDGFPDFFAGPVASGVAEVQVDISGAPPVVVSTVPAPDSLGLPIRLFAAPVTPGSNVEAVVAVGEDGSVLERLAVGPTHPAATTTITDANGHKAVIFEDAGGP